MKLIVYALLAAILISFPARAEGLLLPAQQQSTRLMVFVHGILSSAEKTWTNPTTKVYWPNLVRSDPAFESSDIYVYNYRSGLDIDSASITDIAGQFAADLGESANIRKYSDVQFVAHSMGGVIVRKYLLEQSRLRDRGVLSGGRIKGLYLFSSPMRGSAIADLGSELFRSKTLWQLTTSNDPDAFLNDLRSSWINAGLGTEIKSDCGFETKGVVRLFWLSQKVVDAGSAEPLCNTGFTGLPDRDHGEVVKPENASAYPHLLLRQWYKRIHGNEHLGSGDVVLASCGYDQYGAASNSALSTSLFDRSISHHVSLKLPNDWTIDATPLLWRGNPPKVIVIHYSCFQNGPGDPHLEERRQDFNKFLADVGRYGVKVVTYSRAFYPKFVVENISSANRKEFVDTKRIVFMKLHFDARRRAEEFSKLAQAVEKMTTR